MSNDEFSVEFDLLFNNISSNQAPGLNELEKSIFLTEAQDVVVKELYSKVGFEHDEETMQYLRPLEKTFTTENLGTIDEKYGLNEYNIKVPEDTDKLFVIVNEYATAADGAGCSKVPYLTVLPVKKDEIDRIIKNPFRSANNTRVLRVVCNDTNKNTITLYSSITLGSYEAIYLKHPSNIVLKGATEFDMDGYKTEASCELPEGIHRTILLRAVQIAQSVWK